MFSNKLLRISLKIRLAFTYTLFFFISCILIFTVFSLRVYREINRIGDEELFRIADNITDLYHNSLQNSRNTIVNDSRSDYPESDRAVLEKRFPGMELISADRLESLNNSSSAAEPTNYYTAYIFHRNQYYECRVRRDGSVYSKLIKKNAGLRRLREQLDAAANPQKNAEKALKQKFRELGRFHGQNEFFAIIWDYENEKYLMHAGAKPAVLAKIVKHETTPSTGFEIEKFRCIYTDIPDLGRFIVGRSIKNRDAIIRQSLMIFVGILFSGTGIGIAVAWLIARRFIRGIKQTTLAMKSISDGDYSYRIAEIPYNDEEIVTLMETFNDMNERTENLLKDIKMMSDNVAHDLRTPLTRISGTVELLLSRRELSDEVRDVCVSVLEEILRLKSLVNTIMDISRTSAQPDSLKKESIDLTGLIRNFCDFMLPAFEEKSLKLTTDLPGNPLIMTVDKTMFQRMLANLIENSLKFTTSGGTTIRLYSKEQSAVLEISDTGCGISPQDLPYIFDRFFRADASRHLSGNGLGLALVKAVVTAHNWELDVKSVPGKGTSFIINMPNQTGVKE